MLRLAYARGRESHADMLESCFGGRRDDLRRREFDRCHM
jgi:hypothetical protein